MLHRSGLGNTKADLFNLPPFSSIAVLVVISVSLNAHSAFGVGATWTNPNGGTTAGNLNWNVNANWDTDPNPFPNGIDVIANFPSTQPSNRLIEFGAGQDITLGTFNIDNSTAFFNQFGTATGTFGGQSLTFDVSSGSAAINVTGHTTTTNANGNSIRVPVTLNDNLVVTTDWVKNDYSAIALNFLVGSMTGAGGITKNGLGTLSFADVDKAFTGPVVVNQGRFRLNNATTMSGTSSVTVNDGGQIALERTGNDTFGPPGTIITLNGLGTVPPPAGFGFHFPGAIRTGTNLTQTFDNPIVLASRAAINQVGATGSLTLNGVMSGPGTFVSGALSGDPAAQGSIVLTAANTYTGGTQVQLGTLVVSSGSSLGTGAVKVDGTSSFNANQGLSRAAGKLQIQGAGAIADSAYLNITGDEGVDGVVGGYAILDAGVNETIGGLMLGGVIFGAGTYGSASSGAPNPGLSNPDVYFQGSGTVTVVPAGVPGDYNGNGTVDASDFVLWRKEGPLHNDFTPGVQASDFDFWRSRFAATTNPGSGLGGGAGVPEPSLSSIIAMFAAIVISIHRPTFGVPAYASGVASRNNSPRRFS